MSVIRGEQWKLAYAPETKNNLGSGTYAGYTSYGTSPLTQYYTHQFGILQSATLPDPQMDFVPIWGLGTSSYRNPYVIYRGKQALNCSLSDFMLIDGTPIRWAFGGITEGTFGGITTHNIYEEQNTLDSLSMHATYVNCDTGATVLMRRWYGGKVNRAVFSAREEDFLKMSCDINFIKYGFVDDGTGSSLPGYDSNIQDINPVINCDQPYLFSYGSLTLDGHPFARVRAFRLTVDNGLQAKYYLNSTNQIVRLPYEYRESRRTYKLSVDIDIEDAQLYREVVAQGVDYNSSYTGFQTIFTMTRGSSDYIQFIMPANTPGCAGNAMGCFIASAPHNISSNDQLVTVSLDILVRQVGVTVSDIISSYP
jgi:hypothetical protein